MSKRVSDFYSKNGADKKAIEDYLKQLEQERLKELAEQKAIADKIYKSSEKLKNESK